MRPQRKIPESDLETIKLGLKQAKTTIEYRHTHVLYLRGSQGKTAKEIATITNYSEQQVRAIVSGYFKLIIIRGLVSPLFTLLNENPISIKLLII